MYYINLLLEIKSDKISQCLLSFCEDKCMDLAYKDVHLFFRESTNRAVFERRNIRHYSYEVRAIGLCSDNAM